MTPEQINIKIAEACGWVQRIYGRWGEPNEPDDSFGVKDKVWDRVSDLPNYCNDLNAMHEAEKALSPRQEVLYVHCLSDLVFNDERWDESELCADNMVYCATALQRAEAFLRALNKWGDTNA